MGDPKIITNNQPRDILYGYNLPEKWRNEFDYLSDEEYDTHSFVFYRNWVYDLSEFLMINGGPFSCNPPQDSILQKWDGVLTDSFFSGIVIRFYRDNYGIDLERVVCGLYLC